MIQIKGKTVPQPPLLQSPLLLFRSPSPKSPTIWLTLSLTSTLHHYLPCDPLIPSSHCHCCRHCCSRRSKSRMSFSQWYLGRSGLFFLLLALHALSYEGTAPHPPSATPPFVAQFHSPLCFSALPLLNLPFCTAHCLSASVDTPSNLICAAAASLCRSPWA